jgi:diacylglycerol kinase
VHDLPADGPRRGARGYRAAISSRVASFRYAFAGLRYVLGEPNFRIQLGLFALALIAAGLFRVRPGEWLAIVLVGLAVLLMEMLNTVIESLVDLAAPSYHPLARTAKDVAAGAVLLSAIAAVIVGIYIFVPRLLTWLHGLL